MAGRKSFHGRPPAEAAAGDEDALDAFGLERPAALEELVRRGDGKHVLQELPAAVGAALKAARARHGEGRIAAGSAVAPEHAGQVEADAPAVDGMGGPAGPLHAL